MEQIAESIMELRKDLHCDFKSLNILVGENNEAILVVSFESPDQLEICET